MAETLGNDAVTIDLVGGGKLFIGLQRAFRKSAHNISRNNYWEAIRALKAVDRKSSNSMARLRALTASLGGTYTFGLTDGSILRNISNHLESRRLIGVVVGFDEASFARNATLQQLRTYEGRVGGNVAGPKLFPDGTMDVVSMRLDERILWVLGEVPNQLDAGDFKQALMDLLNPYTLGLTAVVLAAWAGSHLFGIGFGLDAVIMAIGLIAIGWSIFSAMDHMIEFMKLTYYAKTKAELEQAADQLAKALVDFGIGFIVAFLTKGASRLAPKSNALAKSSGGTGAPAGKPKTPTDPDPKSKKTTAVPSTVPDVTYRGDTRSPSEIFSDGFKPRTDKEADLLEYARGNVETNAVSTSSSSLVGERFAKASGQKYGLDETYVYSVNPPKDSIDVNKVLGDASPYKSEVEFLVPDGVRPDQILGAQKLVKDVSGSFVRSGPFIPNPNYVPPGT